MSFIHLNINKKDYILLHDEIYILKILQYHGGKIFRKAENDTNLLAKTMLRLMISSLRGGPKFFFKMIPVTKLNAECLREKVRQTMYNIEAASGKVKAIISDGNRINQSFFNYFKTAEGKLWLSVDGTYLLYNYVHLIKTIRNLWLTEKTGELKFQHEYKFLVANWYHLRNLFQSEVCAVLKMSKISETAVYPNPNDRQREVLVSNFFCDDKATALELYGRQLYIDVIGTVIFIRKVLKWWTISLM